MKKLLSMMVAILTAVFLSACGSNTENGNSAGNQPEQQQGESSGSGSVESAVLEPDITYIPDTDFLMPSSIMHLDPSLYAEEVTDQRGIMGSVKLYVAVHFNGDEATADKNLKQLAKDYEAYLEQQFPSGQDSRGNKITAEIAYSQGAGDYYRILVVFPE